MIIITNQYRPIQAQIQSKTSTNTDQCTHHCFNTCTSTCQYRHLIVKSGALALTASAACTSSTEVSEVSDHPKPYTSRSPLQQDQPHPLFVVRIDSDSLLLLCDCKTFHAVTKSPSAQFRFCGMTLHDVVDKVILVQSVACREEGQLPISLIAVYLVVRI